MTHTLRTTCRLCSGSLRLVLSLPDVPLANAYAHLPAGIGDQPDQHYPMQISQCEACGHVQCPVVVDPLLLFSDYAYTTGSQAAMRKNVGELADRVASIGGFLVDVGSNDGYLLSEAQKRGMLTIGIDPAQNLAAEATAKGRITLPAFLTQSLATQLRNIIGRSCTVTALNVFAHADDLGHIADAVRELIRPNGTFVFEVAYLLDVLEKSEVGTCYHEHLSHHHVAPLVGFFQRHGMSLVQVERIASQGGSIRCYVQCGGVPDRSASELVALERSVLPGMLEMWQARLCNDQADLLEMIKPYAGKGLAMYGAPARMTTWAYTMGLRASDVSVVFDDEPRKVGRFTPGLRWPIVSSGELVERNPPAVLIASWNHAEDIKRRHPDYRGVWLMPPRSA